MRSRSYAGLVAFPLAMAVRCVDPLLPILRFINLFLKRLLFPRITPEPDLEMSDIERAVELSTQDAIGSSRISNVEKHREPVSIKSR